MKNLLGVNINLFLFPVIFFLFAVFLCMNGILRIDYNDYEYMTTHFLTTNPAVSRQFLYGSPFTFALGWPITSYFGATVSFEIVYGIGLILFFIVLGKHLYEKFCRDDINKAFFVLMTTPVFFILTHWFGKSDAYLLAFFLSIYWLRSEWAIFFASFLVVLCHREMGSILLLFRLLISRKNIHAILLGLIAGNIGVYCFEHYALSSVPQQNRAAYALEGWSRRVRKFIADPLSYLVYCLGGFWIYIICLVRPLMLEILMFVVAFSLSILAADSTRVFCILAFPLVISMVGRMVSHPGFIGLHNKKIVILLVLSTMIHNQVA